MDELMTFDDLNLHDSSVLKLELSLDMTPKESFVVWLNYVEDYNLHTSSVRKLTFLRCREVRLLSHLGFFRNNSIREGGMRSESELLRNSKAAWAKVGVSNEITDAWKHYYLHTNTGSELDVIAEGFDFERDYFLATQIN